MKDLESGLEFPLYLKLFRVRSPISAVHHYPLSPLRQPPEPARRPGPRTEKDHGLERLRHPYDGNGARGERHLAQRPDRRLLPSLSGGPCDTSRSLGNAFRVGQVTATQAIISLDGPTAGAFTVYGDFSFGTADVIIDVDGYFAQQTTSTPDSYNLTFRDAQNHLTTKYNLAGGFASVDKDYVYLGNQLVATWQPSTGCSFFMTDHLGTPRLQTDVNANLVTRAKNRAFGLTLTGALPQQGPEFAAMEKDASSGNHYDHARFYASWLGRFQVPDLVGGNPGDPQSWNRYAYARNNPLKYVDPNGLWPTRGLLGFFGGHVHQRSIDRALAFLPKTDRAILKTQQREIDKHQKDQTPHAMANVGGSSSEARSAANMLVKDEIGAARALEAAGDHTGALRHLAVVIHTLQDATSPTHQNFQPWTDNIFGQFAHIAGEDFDPGEGSELDAVTREAYDYFTGGQVPEDVFANIRTDERPRDPGDPFAGTGFCSADNVCH